MEQGTQRFPSNALMWTEVGFADRIADRLIFEKAIREVILVSIDAQGPRAQPPVTPEAELATLVTFERYVLDEVVPRVEAQYRVENGRELAQRTRPACYRAQVPCNGWRALATELAALPGGVLKDAQLTDSDCHYGVVPQFRTVRRSLPVSSRSCLTVNPSRRNSPISCTSPPRSWKTRPVPGGRSSFISLQASLGLYGGGVRLDDSISLSKSF
jgi:hypothetical protein